MTTIKTIIIEDEINNAKLLEHFIIKYCPEIELIATCKSKNEAVESIKKLQPQLLFLDIILDDHTAFELLEEIDYSSLNIIFITAFDEYALKAFQYNAADYLLKPIQIDELIASVKRVVQRVEKNEFVDTEQINTLSNTLQSANPKFITISNIDKVNFVKNEEILYCKSTGRYTEFYLTDKRKLVASKSLGEYEELFDPKSFFRIHRSFIVNLNYITNINKKAGNYCELTNGQSLPISRRRMESLIQFLRHM